MVDFVFQSSLPARYHDALEALVFFNPRQRNAETAIAEAVDVYGTPAIVSSPSGLRVTVSRREDVQCLFALAPEGNQLALAGMVMYLRTSIQEVVVLHIGVAERYSRSRRSGLEVVLALVCAVRSIVHRLRGVERLTMLYLRGRQFRISLASDQPVSSGVSAPVQPAPAPP